VIERIDNTILVLFGRKGSGKTTLVKEIASGHPRVFVLDTIGEYEEGFVRADGLEACVDAVMEARGRRQFCYSLRVVEEAPTGQRGELAILDLIYESHERALVVVEEVSQLCSPVWLPREVAQLVRYGRHKRIHQIYVARRPSEVHRDLTSNADLVATFEQREPRDLAYLAQYMGPEGMLARTLPLHRVLVYGELQKAPVALLARRDKSWRQSRLGLSDDEENFSLDAEA